LNKEYDFIITGQGIAGSLLAWFLLQAGKKVLVVDPQLENTCSRIAAGMIHPITGRRIVKSWNADVFIPFAKATYKDIEDKLAEKFFEDYPVFEIYHDIGHRNDWAGRSASEGMSEYVKDECDATSAPKGSKAPFGGRWVVNGGWLDTRRFLDTIQRYLQGKNSFHKGILNYEEVKFGKEFITWGEYKASKIIDCSGVNAISHPLFNHLPFKPCKGELLQIESDGLPKDCILHGNVKVIPLGGYQYICGATYDFNTIDEIPTQEGKEKLRAALEKIIAPAYRITGHFASIRPSTVDRRPLLKQHKDQPLLYIFNGLGSKGVMMGPWMASLLVKHLVYGERLVARLRD
jgi:glycine oxidase